MGSIFSELFNNWVNAFEQEEGKKKPIHLPNAKENYRETAKYQMIPSATKAFMSSFGQTQSFFTYFSFSPCVMPSKSSTIRPRSFQTSFLAPPIFSPKSLIMVKCIFKFYLARVNSIPVEITSAWIFPSSFYKILLQMIPCLCRRRIK